MFGAIEAGGTKMVCAIGDGEGGVAERIRIPTRSPEETIPELIRFFAGKKIQALGIGSFGPADIKPGSPTYGHLTATPKPGWAHFPFVPEMQKALGVPVAFTTDVNASALGEYAYGAGKGTASCLYITVGTGIGAGAVVGGKLLEGLSHPEMGHIRVRRNPLDTYVGCCPYHGDCLEGLAAGPAIEQRWGIAGSRLPAGHEAWEWEADYLAEALMQYLLILSPKKIIIGGGVMEQVHLLEMIRERVGVLAGDFIQLPALEKLIVPPALGADSGIWGALALAAGEFE